MKKVSLCVKIPETVKEHLKEMTHEGRTVTDLVNYALEDFLSCQYLKNMGEDLMSTYTDLTRHLTGFKDLEPRVQAAYMRQVARNGVIGYYQEQVTIPLSSLYAPYWAEQGRP